MPEVDQLIDALAWWKNPDFRRWLDKCRLVRAMFNPGEYASFTSIARMALAELEREQID